MNRLSVDDMVSRSYLTDKPQHLHVSRVTNSLTYYGLILASSSLSGNRFLNYFLMAIVEYPSALAEFILIRK